MRKLMLGLASLSAAPMFAADSDVDFSAATTALSSISEALKSWVTSALPILVGIAAAFLGFFLVKVVIRLVKGMSKS